MAEISSCGNTQEDLTANDMELKLVEVRRNLECEEKVKLEVDYCLCINGDALDLVCDIVGRYFQAMGSDDGGERSVSPETMVLQRMAVKLLEEACMRMRHSLNTNEDENRMDQGEYFLYRSLVELEEIKKEKDHASQLWIPHVRREYIAILNAWNTVIGKWKHLLMSCEEPESRAQEINTLLEIKAGLIQRMHEVDSESRIDFIYEQIKELGTIMNEIVQSTNECFRKHITVTARVVAEVASPVAGIPASWILNSWKSPLQDLRNGLLKNLAVQSHAVLVITNALSRQRPRNGNKGSRPIGSFLLLSDSNFYRLELAEALADQLYNDKCRVMSFDLSDDNDLHILGDYKHKGGVGGRLIEGVKNMPFTVLLLENIDEATKRTIDIILQIVEGGGLIDCHGNIVDFSKTLIIMISDVGKNDLISDVTKKDLKPNICKCLEKDQDLPIKTVVLSPSWESSHECKYLPVLREVRQHFEDKLFNEVDDIIVFNEYGFQTRHVVARSLLRDIPKKIKQEQLILYPSEAALRSIIKESLRRKLIALDMREHIRAWLEENMVPGLLGVIADNEIKDTFVIYIDVLVGADELSYRLKRGGPEEEMYVCQLKDSLKVSRTIYKEEKSKVDYICSLRKNCFKLINTTDKKDATATDMVEKICSLLDFVIASISVGFKCKKVHKLVPLKSLTKKELRQSKFIPKSSKIKVSENFGGRSYQAIDVLREALLKFVNNEPRKNMARQPVVSFLFLDLSRVGKADLAKCLGESFGTDVVTNINLQEYSEPASLLLQLTDRISEPLLKSNNEAMIPFRVLLIDEVEKAYMPVFGALIALLDHGILRDGQGRIFDFRNTVVVIMSHLGNNKMLAKLVRVAPGAVISDVGNDEGGKRFRTELLNRVDEIIMVNPFNREQLSKVVRLPMKSGRHLKDGTPSSIPFCFHHLFIDSTDPLTESDPRCQKKAVSHLMLGLIKGPKKKKNKGPKNNVMASDDVVGD